MFECGIVPEGLCLGYSNPTLELSHLLLVLDECFVLLNVLLLESVVLGLSLILDDFMPFFQLGHLVDLVVVLLDPFFLLSMHA